MFKKIFFSLFLLFFPLCVFADGFTTSGDLSENRYFDTLGFGVGNLPRKDKCPNCVEYSEYDFKGELSQHILNGISISDVTSSDPKYGLIRNPNLFASLSVPPYTNIDFIYWYRNNSGHDVEISQIKVYLSRYNTSQGDFRNVLNIEGIYESNSLQIYSWAYPRVGIVKNYNGLGVVNMGASGVVILDSVMVKNPIVFETWEAKVEDETVNLEVAVRNTSDVLEANIVFNHQEYSLKRDFQPNEVFVYKYEIPFEDIGNFGYVGIYNPNMRKECTSFGEHLDSTYIGDSAPISGVRGEGFAYISSRVKPWGEAFCITRIPYTIYSSVMIYEQGKQEEVHTEEESEEVVSEDSEVIGIYKLPQTNSKKISLPILLFLVVVLLVWYYLKRKIQR